MPSARAAAAEPGWRPVVPRTGGGRAPIRGTPVWLWASIVLIAALVGALVGGEIVEASGGDAGGTTVKMISTGPALLNGTTDIQSVIDKVLPAVVSIDAKSPEPASDATFGSGLGGMQEDEGTGMIISSDGEVVTNNHVISGATTITVTLYGSLKALPATLIDTDPANDIALLQIEGQSNLPTVSYGDSDDVQVGDAVVAIGNALGLSAGTPTVTQGIISAKGRTVEASDDSGTSTETLVNMMQTDAAINPGNSGGPLVDSSGVVIGMNTAVASSADGTAQAQDIGFAIPSNKITRLLPGLRNATIGDDSQRGSGYLGVDIETLTSQVRSAYDLVPTRGAVVLQVVSGSPAVSAGIAPQDVIVSLDGRAITSADQLGAAIQAERPGRTVEVGLYRARVHKTLRATLGSTAEEPQSVG
ncbi:MAG: trypsin-like peptidase domain-containing protein [Acidimicrobiales bacterium]